MEEGGHLFPRPANASGKEPNGSFRQTKVENDSDGGGAEPGI